MFDVTPLENLFIEEYMLRAPGDFVKVYIYGLRLCYHPVEDATVPAISRALGLEEKTVLDAFAYWERVGVLRRIATACISSAVRRSPARPRATSPRRTATSTSRCRTCSARGFCRRRTMSASTRSWRRWGLRRRSC